MGFILFFHTVMTFQGFPRNIISRSRPIDLIAAITPDLYAPVAIILDLKSFYCILCYNEVCDFCHEFL